MNENTIFHKIIRREIPAEILYEDEHLIIIKDIKPVSPTHLLVIPKKTMAHLSDVQESDKLLIGHMVYTASRIAREQGLEPHGYRLVLNCGESAGQTVDQLHLHLLGGRDFGWPPG
jgi:histidine triad (HIT) family protein